VARGGHPPFPPLGPGSSFKGPLPFFPRFPVPDLGSPGAAERWVELSPDLAELGKLWGGPYRF